MIYFDQGATSFPKLPSVKQAVMDALDHNMNAQRSTGALLTMLSLIVVIQKA